MTALLLLALSLPTTASAETRFDRFLGHVGTVSVTGVVDVPLLSGPYGDEMPYVSVKFGKDDKDSHLFLVNLGADGIVLSPSVAEDLGLKVKEVDKKRWQAMGAKPEDKEKAVGLAGSISLAKLDELNIGDGIVITGSRVQVGPVPQTPIAGLIENPMKPIAGIIGTAGFPGAVAILPSEGVVRFAAADQSEQVLAKVGTAVPYTAVPSAIVKDAMGNKEYHPPLPGVVETTVGTATFKLTLSTAETVSILDRSFKPAGEPSVAIGDFDAYWVTPSIGGVALPLTMAMNTNSSMAAWDGFNGTVGYNALRAMDIAVDGAHDKVALSPAKAQKRQSSLQDRIDMVNAKIQEMDKPLEGKEAEEAAKSSEEDKKAADEEKGKKRAKLLVERGRYYAMDSKYDLAITDLKQAVALNPDPCEYAQYLGEVQFAAGDLQGAAENLAKSQVLYKRWTSLPEKERERIAKMKPEQKKEVATKEQDIDQCDEVAGEIATVDLALGKYDAAIELYTKEHDLHPLLPLAGGIAMIRTGRTADAQGPLRQGLNHAITRGVGGIAYRFETRAALAHVFDVAGNQAAAAELWNKEASILYQDPLLVAMYVDIVRAQKGSEAVIPALTDLKKRLPDGFVAPAFLAAEMQAQGVAGAQAELDAAKKLCETELSYRPNDAGILGTEAYLLAWNKDYPGAKALAEKALAIEPSQPHALLALSIAEGKAGELAKARQDWDKAVAFGALNVGFSRLTPPRSAAVKINVTDTKFELSEKVNFETDKDRITTLSFDVLDEVAAALKAHPEVLLVRVEGHTDARGAVEHNQELSQKRADAVVRYLVSKGIEATRLKAQGYGSTQPLNPASTPEAWEQNRRVEFVIEQKAPPANATLDKKGKKGEKAAAAKKEEKKDDKGAKK